MLQRAAMTAVALSSLLLGAGGIATAQDTAPGRSLGKVSVRGKLVVVELDAGALGKPNLFDLDGRTLRFIPDGARYRVENRPLLWEPDFGPELAGAGLTLHRFAFPFGGRAWRSLMVGRTGSLRFGGTDKDVKPDAYGHPEGGISLDRFDQLAAVAGTLNEKAPAIAIFLKPRLSGPHYAKELADRLVVTWDLTEPYGGYLDFGWFPTVNRFQAVLHSNGTIDMSYKQVAARDAIVGLYPGPNAKPSSVHFSSIRTKSLFAAPFESFHYFAQPRPQDLSCTVIKALGDRFDFLAYYSDFRVDQQEASPASDGPVGGRVSGIGDTMHDQSPAVLASRCTKGRFQQGYLAPVYAGAPEAQKGPPPNAPADSDRKIAFYTRQLADAAAGHNAAPYNYAVGHLGHEFGHRWGAYVTARIGGEIIRLGPWPHWAPGLQTRVAFPYSLPIEASTLGGGAWQDNHDGTFTKLRDGYFVPASGYSYLDLYLMGLASPAEVRDFFILDDPVRIGADANGLPLFRGTPRRVTIDEIIAAEGPRLPDFRNSQRQFNTGMVVMVEHGKRPSARLVREAEGIGRQWIAYWRVVTGGRASMITDPR